MTLRYFGMKLKVSTSLCLQGTTVTMRSGVFLVRNVNWVKQSKSKRMSTGKKKTEKAQQKFQELLQLPDALSPGGWLMQNVKVISKERGSQSRSLHVTLGDPKDLPTPQILDALKQSFDPFKDRAIEASYF